MLVEIHMLQNHAPANLNRDDTGAPKDCVFGGVKRARISSQCLKRSIRRSDVFRSALSGVDLALRTRQLPEEVRKGLLELGFNPDIAEVAAKKATGFGNKEGTEQKELETAQMMLLSPVDMHAVTQAMAEVAAAAGNAKAFEKVPAKEIQARAELKGWRPVTPDIALFGRMITSDAFRDVEASVQVAHALSTHKVDEEFDYFTAVDDLRGSEAVDDKGAGMIGEVEFNSACYYKYFAVDVDGLVDNLVGPEPGVKADAAERERYAMDRRSAQRLAVQSVLGFLRAAVFTTPSGKQNSFAAHQLPDAILVEVKEEKIPVSYANAFVRPVERSREHDLVDASLAALTGHVNIVRSKFGLKTAERLWFTTREGAPEECKTCETLPELLDSLHGALEGRLAHG
jgi:CRISPR system Cascade subunit CasC